MLPEEGWELHEPAGWRSSGGLFCEGPRGWKPKIKVATALVSPEASRRAFPLCPQVAFPVCGSTFPPRTGTTLRSEGYIFK